MTKKLTTKLGLLLLVLLSIPFPYTVVPEWTVQIKHADGGFANDVQVIQMWTDSSVAMGLWMPMERLTTDKHGFVTFPKRTFYAPLLLRGFGNLISYVDFWSHASFGCVSHFSVVGGYYPEITYRPGYKFDETWIIRPTPDSDHRRIEENELGSPASK
jgi:hypothetical protein